jgi:limonene-1,2-epoxide hydrolase
VAARPVVGRLALRGGRSESRGARAVGATQEAIVRRMCELWAVRDADAMAELFAEDGIYHNVPNPPMVGRAAVQAYLRKVCERLGVEAELLHLACDGEWVLSERLDTHVEGDRRMSLPVMNISRVVNGELTLWRDYYDTRMVRDLGLV